MDDHYFDDYPDVDRRSCRLLGPTALITQGLMGILVVSSLVYKRHRESPKRPWPIWSFDVSKQIIGQMFVHGLNVLISDIVSRLSSGNACVLYFLNILVDTTLGVAVIYLVLQCFTYLLSEKCHFKGFESGQYGNPPSFWYWLRQATVYVLSLTIMKLLVIALFAAWPGIFSVGEWLLSFLGTSDALQVIFVMGLFPILMNVLQFWLIDSIVKASTHSSVALPDDETEDLTPETEPLFQLSDDEDDEDGSHTHVHDIENPRPLDRTQSRPSERELSPMNDSKLRSSSKQPSASSSSTPPLKTVHVESQAIEIHAYPPSNTATPQSSVSSHSARSSSSRGSSRLRRSPPPPLALHPRSPAPMAVNSPLSNSPLSTPPIVHQVADQSLDEKDWAAWDENGEDWADRVGEEDWTGKRIEDTKAIVDNAWALHTPSHTGPIIRSGS